MQAAPGGSLSERVALCSGLQDRLRSKLRSSGRAPEVLRDAWGFSRLPSLHGLFQDCQRDLEEDKEEAAAVESTLGEPGDPEPGAPTCGPSPCGPESGVLPGPLVHRRVQDALSSSRSFRSPHCEGEMARHLGCRDSLEGLAGSVALPLVPEEAAEALRGALKEHINLAWGSEAVKCGVGCAKAGNYDEALKYYNRAIELCPSYSDAFVARGAALANQQQLPAAAEDFRHAMKLDAGSRNAAAYLEAVEKRLAEQRAEEGWAGGREGPQEGDEAPEESGAEGERGCCRQDEEENEEVAKAGRTSEGTSGAAQAGPQDDSRAAERRYSAQRAEGSGSASSSSDSDLDGDDVRRALQLILQARPHAASREKSSKKSHKKSHKKSKHKSSKSSRKRRRGS